MLFYRVLLCTKVKLKDKIRIKQDRRKTMKADTTMMLGA